MAETKYGKYYMEVTTTPGPGSIPMIGFESGKAFGGLPFPLSFGYSSYPQPLGVVHQRPHKHDFDQILCWFGGDPLNVGYFGAEIEFSLGEKQEKHVITRPTIVYVPKGTPHCPLNYKTVQNTFMCLDIFLSPKYEMKEVPVEWGKQPVAKTKDETRYGKYYLENPVQQGPFTPMFMLNGEKSFGGLPLSFGWSSYPQPWPTAHEKPHAHDFDQLLCWFGGDPLNMGYLGAEIEFSMGEEQEKHVITKPTIVYVPKGTPHCPLSYKTVYTPFVCLDIFISPKYEMKQVTK